MRWLVAAVKVLRLLDFLISILSFALSTMYIVFDWIVIQTALGLGETELQIC
jgi:hypothetical protein